jgi:hypothetical protein
MHRELARGESSTLTDVKDERAHPIVGLATPESPIGSQAALAFTRKARSICSRRPTAP